MTTSPRKEALLESEAPDQDFVTIQVDPTDLEEFPEPSPPSQTPEKATTAPQSPSQAQTPHRPSLACHSPKRPDQKSKKAKPPPLDFTLLKECTVEIGRAFELPKSGITTPENPKTPPPTLSPIDYSPSSFSPNFARFSPLLPQGERSSQAPSIDSLLTTVQLSPESFELLDKLICEDTLYKKSVELVQDINSWHTQANLASLSSPPKPDHLTRPTNLPKPDQLTCPNSSPNPDLPSQSQTYNPSEPVNIPFNLPPIRRGRRRNKSKRGFRRSNCTEPHSVLCRSLSLIHI